MMAPRRSKWMRRVCPRVDYTQAPWTVVICLGSRAKASTLLGRHTRFVGGSVFHTSFRGLLSLLAIQQKWYHHLQKQLVQSLIPHNYYIHQVQHIHRCIQQIVRSTHTHIPVL